MEDLTNIRNNFKSGAKKPKHFHTWSFHRLQQFIGCKARKEGILTLKVNPMYTSSECPKCKVLTNCKSIFKCKNCDFTLNHRDEFGALNIDLREFKYLISLKVS